MGEFRYDEELANRSSNPISIAVLSDIHGNLTALEAVLDDAKSRGVSGFIIAGDNVGDGPQPGEVVDRIRQLNNRWIIKGNREEYTLNYNDGLKDEWNDYNQMYVAVWTQKCLDSEQISFIRDLPEQLVVNIEGTSPIRVVHGSPFDIYEHLYPDKDLDRLKRVVNSIDESVLICGHTHESWSKVTDNKLVVNPGSVGLHFNDKLCAEYSTLTWSGEDWTEDHHYVKYNIDEVEKAFENTGIFNTGGAIWAKATMCGLRSGSNIALKFLRYAYDFAKKEGMEGSGLIPNDLWERVAASWDYNKKEGCF